MQTSPTIFKDYVTHLEATAKKDIRLLTQLLEQRLLQNDGPPLSRDEHEPADIFFLMCERWCQLDNKDALANLQKASASLFLELLLHFDHSGKYPNFEALAAAKHLTAETQPRNNRQFATKLEKTLLGFLADRLHPLESLCDLNDRCMLILVDHCLDLWTTLQPLDHFPRSRSKHLVAHLKALHHNTIKTVDKFEVLGTDNQQVHDDHSAPFWNLLFSSFNALLVVDPEYVGQKTFLETVNILPSARDRVYYNRWSRTCNAMKGWFEQVPEWGHAFRRGWEAAEMPPEFSAADQPFFKVSQEYLDFLATDSSSPSGVSSLTRSVDLKDTA